MSNADERRDLARASSAGAPIVPPGQGGSPSGLEAMLAAISAEVTSEAAEWLAEQNDQHPKVPTGQR